MQTERTKTKSIHHFVSVHPIRTLIEYIKTMHDEIGHFIHQKVCKYQGILDWEKML